MINPYLNKHQNKYKKENLALIRFTYLLMMIDSHTIYMCNVLCTYIVV